MNDIDLVRLALMNRNLPLEDVANLLGQAVGEVDELMGEVVKEIGVRIQEAELTKKRQELIGKVDIEIGKISGIDKA